MISNPAQILQSYNEYSEENKKDAISHLNKLTSIDFAFKMNDKNYFKLVNYFINIPEDRFKILDPKYFELPGIILLMQSFIAKLRLQTGITQSQELRVLRGLSENITSILIKISPGTVLKSLYQLLAFSPNHQVALKLLNQHPTFFINMIITQRHSNVVLLKAVTNPTGLKLLAKKLSTEEFLREFNTNDPAKIPPVGDKFYGKINDSKLRLFTVVAEPLVRSASLNDKLDFLCQFAPPELISLLQTTIVSLASMNPLPQCIIPYISAISTRFSPSILARIRDPESLVKAIKLHQQETPFFFDSIATIIVKSPYAWATLANYINDLPELKAAIRNYIPYMLQVDKEACINFLNGSRLTDKAAVSTINLIRPLIPESYESILSLSRCGDISFRVAAGIASNEDSLWIQFCEYYSGHNYIDSFLDVITDFINSGNFFRGLELLNYLSIHYSKGNPKINSSIADFIYQKYATFSLNHIYEQYLFVRVFGRVHKFSSSILPILDELGEVSSKCLFLIIRYLWHAAKDANPSLLLFRLKLLAKRYGTREEPRPWTYEIIVMLDH